MKREQIKRKENDVNLSCKEKEGIRRAMQDIMIRHQK